MAENASPRTKFVRPVGLFAAVALLGGVGGWYQLEVRANRAPSFDQGGDFLSELPVAGVDGRPYPYGDASASVSVTTATTLPGSSSTEATTTAPTAAGDQQQPPVDQAPTPTTAPPAVDPLASPTAPVPSTGTYTYAVSGSEGATGFGSRSYPATASYVIHPDPSGSGDLVHDLRLSGQHEERTIVHYGADGAAFTYEAGSITFGPGTQTSQGTYDPPMVQIPWPLSVGATASGVSTTATRTESWTTTVVGQEVIDVLGSQHLTWVVDLQRTTPSGSAEEVDRFRRYWYDPALGTWVKWQERFHAARQVLVTFSYDTEYTATLSSFTPG